MQTCIHGETRVPHGLFFKTISLLEFHVKKSDDRMRGLLPRSLLPSDVACDDGWTQRKSCVWAGCIASCCKPRAPKYPEAVTLWVLVVGTELDRKIGQSGCEKCWVKGRSLNQVSPYAKVQLQTPKLSVEPASVGPK